MSKERLEEIKKNAIVDRVHFKYINNDKGYWGKTYTLIEEDMRWFNEQAERVQELEELKTHYMKQIQSLTRFNDLNKSRANSYREMLEMVESNLGNYIVQDTNLLHEVKNLLEGDPNESS